jgi:hypothetical protein
MEANANHLNSQLRILLHELLLSTFQATLVRLFAFLSRERKRKSDQATNINSIQSHLQHLPEDFQVGLLLKDQKAVELLVCSFAKIGEHFLCTFDVLVAL